MNGNLMRWTEDSGPVWGARRRTGAATATAPGAMYLWDLILPVALRHRPDPVCLGLALTPVTGLAIPTSMSHRPADAVRRPSVH
jgi:hypothetical protein